MKSVFLSGLAVLVGSVGLFGFAGSAKADCLDYFALGNGYLDGLVYVRACQLNQLQQLRRLQSQELFEASTPAAKPSNLYTLDNNANLRSGASGTSGVILNTRRSSPVTVHSWDGDWAWVTTIDGVNGWTHRVNLVKV